LKLSNETKVGLLTAVALTILILGYNYLKGQKLFSGQQTYHAVFNNVSGLLKANPVLLSGLQVGLVEDIQLKDGRTDSFLVTFIVDAELKLPSNTNVTMQSTSPVLGETVLTLNIPSIADASKTFLKDGDTVKGVDQSSLLDTAKDELIPIKEKVDKMMLTLDSTLFAINVILRSDEVMKTIENVSASVGNVQSSLANLEGIVENVNDFTENDLQHVGVILRNVSNLSETLESDIVTKVDNVVVEAKDVLANTERITAKIAEADINTTIDEANSAITEIKALTHEIQNGDGSMSKLINNDELYNNIEDVSFNVNELLVDVKKNPWRYISLFGKKKRTWKNNDSTETPPQE